MRQNKCVLILECLLVLLTFSVCLSGALLLPMDQCPDEPGRRLLSDWLLHKGTLPTGNEPGIMLMLWEDVNAPVLSAASDSGFNGWGFSYAMRPYLSSMIGAGFEKIASFFTDSPRVLLAASRMCSVLSITFCCFFCLKLGHRLFERQTAAILFAVVVCFLPQVMFLGMYQNNDSLSLCAICMMLYYLVEGYDLKWPIKSCIGLGISFSIGLLSYYSVYGWLLMGAVFFAVAIIAHSDALDIKRLFFKRSVLIFGICILLAGWFFVRNAYFHEGDFLGIASEKISRARMEEQGFVLYPYHCYRDDGMTIAQFLRYNNFEWFRMTAESFFGVFGYMLIYLPAVQYGIYYSILGCAIILFLAILLYRKMEWRDRLLMTTMLVSSAITVCLHFWQSYARDYQPQGRYVITLILPLAYMLAYGTDKTSLTVRNPKKQKAAELNSAAAHTVLWLVLFAWAVLGSMMKMIH